MSPDPTTILDHDRLARDFVRSLRGERSQVAFSRRLGYRSNVAYAWESGRRSPTAAEAIRAAVRAGVDAQAAMRRFYREPPPWLPASDLTLPSTIAAFLRDLKGDTPSGKIAAASGLSRFAVARFLSGEAEPRLPDFFRMVESCSLRLLDFCAGFVDPETMPGAADAWRRLESQRRLAYDRPWTPAILRAIELRDYTASPHRPGWIARRLGIPSEVEAEGLLRLSEAGAIRWREDRWEIAGSLAVDTRRDPAAGRRLKAFWAEVGRERIEAGSDGQFSYNLFSVSEADLAEIRELHLAYFRAARAIVARSEPAERVVVINLQLFALDAPPSGSPPSRD